MINDAHQVLHLGGNAQCDLSGAATSSPGDVTEGGSIGHHAVKTLKQVLNTLQGAV